MDNEVVEYRINCPQKNAEVSPVVCKACSDKLLCKSVQELNTNSDMDKWKGTILGGGVDVIIKFRRKVFNFILNDE